MTSPKVTDILSTMMKRAGSTFTFSPSHAPISFETVEVGTDQISKINKNLGKLCIDLELSDDEKEEQVKAV